MSDFSEKTKTLEQAIPPILETARMADVLLCVFPAPRVVRVPRSSEPLGRKWLMDHGLEDPTTSANHLMFSRPGGVLHVADVGSTNGTFVQGRQLNTGERAQLADGTVVRVAKTLFVFRKELSGSAAPAPPFGELIGPFGLRTVEAAVARLRDSPTASILLVGETGTGKELLAREIAARLRPGKPFVAINVAAVPMNMFESQLYGHVRGAFSGAERDSRGVIGDAEGGTVLLDEIGELPLVLQAKLLRLLENSEVFRVGATRPSTVDVLCIGATNRVLDDIVGGRFRRDLYARFARGIIHLPPLRQRAEDIFEIVSSRHHLLPQDVEVDAIERLMLHNWPENIRGLDAVVARALSEDPTHRMLRAQVVMSLLGELPGTSVALTRSAAEKALAAANGNKSEAARTLGIHLSKLRRLLGEALK